MGLLVKGEWHTDWYDTKSNDGEFIRKDSQFRSWVKANPAEGEYPAETGRYHLFVSLACPWAHRTLIMRKLKGLEEVISVSIVKADMLDNGWELDGETPVAGAEYLHQVYSAAQSDYSGRVTVPVLWDQQSQQIINNESAEILRMLNSEFAAFSDNHHDYYPESLRAEINQVNDWVYDTINNGVYKVGFATTQAAYERNFHALFEALDALELRLSRQRYLVGTKLTEADIRLFTTLVRFDAVYVGHFKCNLKRIEDYPNLSNYLRELYQLPGVADTVNFEHIKGHYYRSHTMINPTQVVPLGPELGLDRQHDRQRFAV